MLKQLPKPNREMEMKAGGCRVVFFLPSETTKYGPIPTLKDC